MIEILYEDDEIVAVNKPAGETVIPAPGRPAAESLHHRLAAQLRHRLWVVHRIDRDTSGVVVFARTAEAHRALSIAFERRDVEKTYVAFTAGSLPEPAGRIDIRLHAARRAKMRPAEASEPDAVEAVTEYAVERVWHRHAQLVSRIVVHPRTGRHHQIRVHLRAAGAPILFDSVYGRSVAAEMMADSPCRRLALHASQLVLPPSDTRRRRVIEAPLAADLAALQAWLDAEWTVERATPVTPGTTRHDR